MKSILTSILALLAVTTLAAILVVIVMIVFPQTSVALKDSFRDRGARFLESPTTVPGAGKWTENRGAGPKSGTETGGEKGGVSPTAERRAEVVSLIEGWPDRSVSERTELRAAIRRYGTEVVSAAARAVLARREGPERLFAATLLGDAVEPAALPDLIAALRDMDLGVREAAAEALGAYGPAARGGIEEALKDRDPDIRRAAVRALARSAGAAAIKRLVEIYRGDPVLRVRQAAGDAIRTFPAETRREALAPYADDPMVRALLRD